MTDQPTPDVPVYDRAAWETYRRDARCECTAPDPADCAIQHRPWPSPWMCVCHRLSVVPTAAEPAAAKAAITPVITALPVDPAAEAAATARAVQAEADSERAAAWITAHSPAAETPAARPGPGTAHLTVTVRNPDPHTANRSALALRDWIRAEFGDSIDLTIDTDAVQGPAKPGGTPPVSTAPLASGLPLVTGSCPACGWSSLFLGDGGYVTCARLECPTPDAASTLLEQRPGTPDQLTAREARAEVERLATELYRAQDALAFAGECLTIWEREQPGQPVTTAEVRRWLEGAKCGRQLAAEALPRPSGQPFCAPARNGPDQTAARCPVSTTGICLRVEDSQPECGGRCPFTAAPDRADLRQQYADAIKSVRLRLTPDPITTAMLQANASLHLKDEEAAPFADAVMAVRDTELDELRIETAMQRGVIADYRVENTAIRDKLAVRDAELEQARAERDDLRQRAVERCAACTHPKRDHDGRADHRAKHSPLVAGEPWCHACEATCDYAAPDAERAAPIDWKAIARRRERELKQVGEARHRAETELARRDAAESADAAAGSYAGRAEQAEAAIARVRALHQPDPNVRAGWKSDDDTGAYGRIARACAECGSVDLAVRWPCPTIRALDGTQQPAEEADR